MYRIDLFMKICLKRKIILLTLTFCIAFPAVLTEAITSINLGHDCCPVEKECSPCLQIEASLCFLKTLKMTGLFFLFAGCLMFLFQVLVKNKGLVCYPLSPILLKVRFNT